MLFNQIKTPSHLKMFVESCNSESHFFTRKTMSFFGDTMRNYGVRHTEIEGFHAVELYRKKPVKHGLKASAFFVYKPSGEVKRVFVR